MAKGSFEIRGTGDLVRKLKRNANLNDVKNVVRVNGSEMQRAAQRYSPVDTGALKRSIKYDSLENGFTARVAPGMDYSMYVEYGTRFSPSQPFIRPSYFEQRRKFINDMKRLVK